MSDNPSWSKNRVVLLLVTLGDKTVRGKWLFFSLCCCGCAHWTPLGNGMCDPCVSYHQDYLTLFQVFKRCIQHEVPHPSRQVSQEMPWTSACQVPSFQCPKDPAVHHLGNTSLGLCQLAWPVTAEESATPWWVTVHCHMCTFVLAAMEVQIV